MTLDNNRQQLSDAIRAASEHLDIAPVYIEKDYWITKILQQLSRTSQGGCHGRPSKRWRRSADGSRP